MKPVIQILGPTGAGKSRVALAVARAVNGEIISADSVQVYRGFDIGTDKVSPQCRARDPPSPDRHHRRLRAVQRQQVPGALLRRRRRASAPAAASRWSAAAPPSTCAS